MRLPLVMLVKLALSLGLIGLILARIDCAELFSSLGAVRVEIIVFAFLSYGVGLLLGAKRWQILLRVQGIELPFTDTFLIYWSGCFFNAFLPAGISGDVIASYTAAKSDGRVVESLTSIMLGRVAGIVALGLIAALTLLWLYAPSAVAHIWATAVLLGGTGFQAGRPLRRRWLEWGRAVDLVSKSRGWLQRVGEALLRQKHYKRTLGWVFLLSCLLQVNVILCYFVIAIALGLQLSFVYFCLFIPPILILTMLPVSIGGLGVREVAFLYFFGHLGVTAAELMSLSLWSYFLGFLANLGGGVVYSFYRTTH